MPKHKLSKSGEECIKVTKRGFWSVEVFVGGKARYGGTFSTLGEAIKKRDGLKAEQLVVHMKKAQTKIVSRTAQSRGNLGTFKRNGVTKERKQCERFTTKTANAMLDPLPKHAFQYSSFSNCFLRVVPLESLLYLKLRTPLSAKTGTVRGEIGERVVRKILTDKGADIRERDHVSHDLIHLQSGVKKRIEVKLGRMCWGAAEWNYVAQKVKVKLSDEVYLVFEGLSALYIFRWGGNGYQGTGYAEDAARGGKIVVNGDFKLFDPEAAEKALLRNFERRGNVLVGVAAYNNTLYSAIFERSTKTECQYASVPLGTLQAKSRGDVLELVVANVLTTLGCTVELPDPGSRSNGDSRPQCSAECDRLIDGIPCEIKSSLMSWLQGRIPHYKLTFAGIVSRNHKHRYLAWMSPFAIHIWKQSTENVAGFVGTAMSQDVVFHGPQGRDLLSDPAEAETFLLKKMAFNGLEYVARLDFGPEDFANYEAAIAGKIEEQ